MEEKDKLKEYIGMHRIEFDDELLPPEMMDTVLNAVRQKKKFRVRRMYSSMAAASVVLIVVAAYFIFLQPPADAPVHVAVVNIQPQKTDETTVQKVVVEPEVKSKKEKPVVRKKVVARKAEPDHTITILAALTDSASTARRIDAVLKAGDMINLNNNMREKLCLVFQHDPSGNVRLATLNVLSNYLADEKVQHTLEEGMTAQKDPIIQLELIRLMQGSKKPEVTEKLIQVVVNPLTMEEVKDQAYYALLVRQ